MNVHAKPAAVTTGPVAGSRKVFSSPADRPDIAVPFRAVTADAAKSGEAHLWAAYDALRSQTLLLRGADSDLLSRDTAIEMSQRGPRAKLVEFEGVGHAPTFVDPLQIAAVTNFLFN